LWPTTPQKAEGPRIEPPVSDPVAPRTRPAASAAPLPLVGVPGVARRRPGQVEGGAADGELVGGELAEEHGSGLRQPGGDGRVPLRHMVFEDARMRGRADALGRVDVLEPDRDAVERPFAPAGGDLGLGLPRVLAGAIRGDEEEARKLSVEGLDAAKAELGELDRRQRLGLDQPRRLGDGGHVGEARAGVHGCGALKISAGSADIGRSVPRRSRIWRM
jgi:hypothetical protein